MKRKVKKLLNENIIVTLTFSKWVANLVPVRKKNGEIRPCVYFRNLNKVSLKNYPLPKMAHILQKVVEAERISTMDGFFGYNQIKVLPEDQEKNSFTTPWVLLCMPRCFWVDECRSHLSKRHGYFFC